MCFPWSFHQSQIFNLKNESIETMYYLISINYSMQDRNEKNHADRFQAQSKRSKIFQAIYEICN